MVKNPERDFLIPGRLLERILQHLWQRPMHEAYEIFNELNTLVQTQMAAESVLPKPMQARPQTPLHRDQITTGN